MKACAGAFLAVSLAWAGSPIRQAPTKSANMSNPFDADERAQRAGAKLYARECSACHGAHREGAGRAPSLNRPEIYQAPPGTLFWVRRKGAIGRGMPCCPHLREQQLCQVFRFLLRV